MNIDPSRKVLLQLIGKADGAPTPEDLADPIAGIERIGGPLFAQVAQARKDIGVEPTERGGGLGEWDCGAFVDANDIGIIAVAMTDRFRAAFKSHLLRWHLSVLDVHTDVYTKPKKKDSSGG